MKNLIKFGIVAVLAIATFSCTSKTEVKTTSEVKAVNKDSIKTIIANMETRYGKGMETKNMSEIMPYYADDVKSFDAGSAPLVGAAAVEKSLSEMMTKLPQGTKITMESEDVVISKDGSLVTENGRYTASDSSGAKMVSGRFLATFELRDGQYKCVREMMAEDKPAAK